MRQLRPESAGCWKGGAARAARDRLFGPPGLAALAFTGAKYPGRAAQASSEGSPAYQNAGMADVRLTAVEAVDAIPAGGVAVGPMAIPRTVAPTAVCRWLAECGRIACTYTDADYGGGGALLGLSFPRTVGTQAPKRCGAS